MEPLTGGLSSEVYRLDDGRVLRFAPDGPGIFPEYDLRLQATVQEHVAAHGVPAPAPATVATDATSGRIGMTMPFVEGHVPGPVAQLDPWVTSLSPEARASLYGNLLDVLAAIHRVPPPSGLEARDEVAHWAAYLDWSGAVPDRLRAAFEWCRAHEPAATAPPVLLWGDVRLGNLVLDDEASVVAVLDWEMVSVGAAEHDLAWLLGLERMQDELFGTRVEGFPSVDEARARAEQLEGRPLDHFHWYEVFALVRSVAIMCRLQHVEGKRVQADALLDVIDARLALDNDCR